MKDEKGRNGSSATVEVKIIDSVTSIGVSPSCVAAFLLYIIEYAQMMPPAKIIASPIADPLLRTERSPPVVVRNTPRRPTSIPSFPLVLSLSPSRRELNIAMKTTFTFTSSEAFEAVVKLIP